MATNSMARQRGEIANDANLLANDGSLIANETHSREESSNEKQRNYEILIANEFRSQNNGEKGRKADSSSRRIVRDANGASSATADSLPSTTLRAGGMTINVRGHEGQSGADRCSPKRAAPAKKQKADPSPPSPTDPPGSTSRRPGRPHFAGAGFGMTTSGKGRKSGSRGRAGVGAPHRTPRSALTEDGEGPYNG
jgi:hypothetical protein